jgi:hypothetical protein
MSNLTSVGITAGVPTSGTGTVSTIDALMADGGQATVGSMVDTAYTTGSGSLVAILKGLFGKISAALVAQGSTTSGQSGELTLAAVTTASPSYTSAQTSPLSLDVNGGLRVNVIAGGAGGGVVTQATGTNLHTVVDSLPPVLGSGAAVTVTPTVTAGAYTAGYVMGGIMTFASILPASFNGILESLALRFKGTLQTGSFAVALFSASPAGTFADHGAPAIAGADTALLLGVYQLSAAQSELGTHTIYCLDGIGKQIVGASTSLFAVVVAITTPTAPASTSEMSLQIGVVQ